MTRIEKSIEINASPEKVWPLIAHERIPEWFELFKKVESTSKEKDNVGATHHMTSEIAGVARAEWDGETTEWIENKMYAWRSIGGHFTGFGSMILSPTNTGTKFSMMMDYELPYSVLGKMIDKLRVHRVIDNSINEGLKKLKDMLEK